MSKNTKAAFDVDSLLETKLDKINKAQTNTPIVKGLGLFAGLFLANLAVKQGQSAHFSFSVLLPMFQEGDLSAAVLPLKQAGTSYVSAFVSAKLINQFTIQNDKFNKFIDQTFLTFGLNLPFKTAKLAGSLPIIRNIIESAGLAAKKRNAEDGLNQGYFVIAPNDGNMFEPRVEFLSTAEYHKFKSENDILEIRANKSPVNKTEIFNFSKGKLHGDRNVPAYLAFGVKGTDSQISVLRNAEIKPVIKENKLDLTEYLMDINKEKICYLVNNMSEKEKASFIYKTVLDPRKLLDKIEELPELNEFDEPDYFANNSDAVRNLIHLELNQVLTEGLTHIDAEFLQRIAEAYEVDANSQELRM